VTDSPLFCHRCGKQLHPGRGDFFVVSIDAVADPSPPIIDDADQDPRETFRELTRRLEEISPQEAMDQVHRRVVLHLCLTCYHPWIEDPTSTG
jgi:hypothetical protein